MAVVEVEQAKAYLGMDSGDQEPRLADLIDVAQAAIAERVGPLEPISTTVRVPPLGRTLAVPSPASALTSVIDADGTTLDVSSLYLDKRPGLITSNDGTAFTARWYDVTYDHGRATGECPSHLIEAVLVLVKHLYDPQRGVGARGGISTSDGAANTIPGAGYLLPNRCLELIGPERPQMVG